MAIYGLYRCGKDIKEVIELKKEKRKTKMKKKAAKSDTQSNPTLNEFGPSNSKNPSSLKKDAQTSKPLDLADDSDNEDRCSFGSSTTCV